MSKAPRLISIWPHLRSSVAQLHLYSVRVAKTCSVEVSQPSERDLGPFVYSKSFPLPGMVGTAETLEATPSNSLAETSLSFIKLGSGADASLKTTPSRPLNLPKLQLECQSRECPRLLKNELKELWPERPNLASDMLTVITLSQRTTQDMSGWSYEVESEREDLLKLFIDCAKELSSHLSAVGFWVDFIDPSSGKPYFGADTNACLFETDERYRHMGFTIEDLGCCKVTVHHSWGTHVYVGSIFTNASFDDPVITRLLDLVKLSGDDAEHTVRAENTASGTPAQT